MAERKKSIDEQVMGSEPEYPMVQPLTSLEVGKAFNWYNYMKDANDARQYVKTYLTNQGKVELSRQMNDVPDIWFSTTAGWTARLITNGYTLPDGYVYRLDARINDMLIRIPVKEKETVVRNIVDFKEEKNKKILESFDDNVEARDLKFVMYDWLHKNTVTITAAQLIKDTYQAWYVELQEVNESKDSQLTEAYRCYSKSQIRVMVKWFESVFLDIDKYCNNVKKARKPRQVKQKKVDPKKLLKDFKYCKEFNKIASVNPEKILTSSEIWLFDTTYNKLTVLRVARDQRFSIKGTTIYGFDEEKSMSKSIGRKVDEILKIVTANQKSNLKVTMDGIKATASKATGRCSEKTLIIRMF